MAGSPRVPVGLTVVATASELMIYPVAIRARSGSWRRAYHEDRRAGWLF